MQAISFHFSPFIRTFRSCSRWKQSRRLPTKLLSCCKVLHGQFSVVKMQPMACRIATLWLVGLVFLASRWTNSVALAQEESPTRLPKEHHLSQHEPGRVSSALAVGTAFSDDKNASGAPRGRSRRRTQLWPRYRPWQGQGPSTLVQGRSYTTVRRPDTTATPWRRPVNTVSTPRVRARHPHQNARRRYPGPKNIFRKPRHGDGRKPSRFRKRTRDRDTSRFRTQLWPRFPAPAPTPPPLPTVQVSTDFSTATAQDPQLLAALAEPGSEFVVDVSLPSGDSSRRLYLLETTSADIGDACPPSGGSLISTPSSSDSVDLSFVGSDKELVLCRNDEVVGLSYFLFEDFSDVGGNLVDPQVVRAVVAVWPSLLNWRCNDLLIFFHTTVPR